MRAFLETRNPIQCSLRAFFAQSRVRWHLEGSKKVCRNKMGFSSIIKEGRTSRDHQT